MSVEFLDTNILVYAYDKTAGPKHGKARSLVARLWSERQGALSTQVLQELYVTLTRKIKRPLPPEAARARVRNLGRWTLVSPGLADVLAPVDLSQSASISFWDALIVRAALQTRAITLWTEDLQDGWTVQGLQIRNPFR